MTAAADPGQRIDQWLWFARIAKSRSLAQELIERGKVRVNKLKVSKTSHWLKAGDTITIALGPRVRVLKVESFGERRGPAREAAGLYQELTPAPDRTTSARDAASPGEPAPQQDAAPVALRSSGSGRPTKRDRRAIDRLRRPES
jgi:ribosome-associated heat shock protein Hsp15